MGMGWDEGHEAKILILDVICKNFRAKIYPEVILLMSNNVYAISIHNQIIFEKLKNTVFYLENYRNDHL